MKMIRERESGLGDGDIDNEWECESSWRGEMQGDDILRLYTILLHSFPQIFATLRKMLDVWDGGEG